ncbi:tetratricopeptide repeat protein [Afifella sp. IM 167]|uniref:tetratricopeptide repeat protein n=1 Tax=Afifella sp. IM 167 TaxID=2033586 RepID=UPI001CC9BAE6|nr:tetratricopeptide repeat protein [Afifella sp. IM 167]
MTKADTRRPRRARHSPALLALVTALLLAAPAPAGAAQEPGPGESAYEESNRELDRLFAMLAKARSEPEARQIENRIWQAWMVGPDRRTSEMMQDAMKARSDFDYDKALSIIEEVIKMEPEYSEAWNQRATLHFLKEDFDRSLDDINRVLELEPRHFGALAGRGVILMRQGRFELGQKALRQAVEIDPWLRERSMIIPTPEEGRPLPPGAEERI